MNNFLRAGHGGLVGSISDWCSEGCELDPSQVWRPSFVEIDHIIFSTVILSRPLIQEGQLSVYGKMCIRTGQAHRGLSLPTKKCVGKLIRLNMTLSVDRAIQLQKNQPTNFWDESMPVPLDSYQTVLMDRLVWVFAGHTSPEILIFFRFLDENIRCGYSLEVPDTLSLFRPIPSDMCTQQRFRSAWAFA